MPANVIFGTGPLGLAVARRLASAGKQVRLVNRSGDAPAPQGAEVVAADATDLASSRKVCEGAAVVYHCATGAYGRWAQFLSPLMNGIIEGASAAHAKLVYGDNLYAYGLLARRGRDHACATGASGTGIVLGTAHEPIAWIGLVDAAARRRSAEASKMATASMVRGALASLSTVRSPKISLTGRSARARGHGPMSRTR